MDIEAEVLADGSLHALRVEAKDAEVATSTKTRLEGVFQGVDPDDPNIWIISGTPVVRSPIWRGPGGTPSKTP